MTVYQSPQRAVGGRRNHHPDQVTREAPHQHLTQVARHGQVKRPDVAAPLGTGQGQRHLASSGLDRSDRPSKRVSDGPPDHERRRTVTRTAHEYDDIDDIPHRSSPCRSPLVTPNTSFTSKSTATTKQSFTSSIFSTKYESETSLSSQETSSQSSTYQQELPITLPDRPVHTGPEVSQPTTPPKKPHLSLESKLDRIWPKLPESLYHAPLAVLWEVTRAAAHCGVDVGKFDLGYEPNNAWHDQKQLRGQLATKSKLFNGKGLPPQCNDAAWAAALGSFKSGHKIVVLSAELTQASRPDEPFYNMKLEPLDFRLGHRLDRRWGSDRLLEISIPTLAPSKSSGPEARIEREKSKTIIRWLCSKPHYFLGRMWAPFFTRPSKKTIKDHREPEKSEDQFLEQIYFFAMDGNHFVPFELNLYPPQTEAEMPQERTKLSLSDLLEWAISGCASGAQPIPKLFSRIALNLSRTIPTVTLKPEQIRFERDVVSKTTRKIMNDGIGRISRSLAQKIAAELGLAVVPCAYQARFGSAKGMWVIDVRDGELHEDDWIELYDSQIKWKCDFQDPQHLTFEVKSWPRKLVSNSLNQQFIPILETQAPSPAKKLAMREVIANHLRKGLEEELCLAKGALNNSAQLSLWIEKYSRNLEQLDEGFIPFLGGLPNQSENKISFLVNSGFQPQSNSVLRDMVHKLVDKRTQLLKKKWNIQVPCSTTALIVVDFEGKLRPDEVHLSFSSNFEVEGFSDTLLEGRDVLVARSPSHFPSDIQKVKVVSLPHLRKLKDVIVFPITGHRALADLLSGGDYDGDRAWVCWDRHIVDNFENTMPPPEFNFIQEGYLREATTSKFGDLIKASSSVSTAYEVFRQTGFEFNMQGSLLGSCTKYKERFCYHGNAINGEKAIALSALLSNLVDQAKAGIEFTRDDWKRFVQNRLRARIFFDDPLYDGDYLPLGREGQMPYHNHILDYLKFNVATPQIERVRDEMKKTIDGNSSKELDRDLIKLAKEMDSRADNGSDIFKEIRRNLKANLKSLREEWSSAMGGKHKDDPYPPKVEELYEKWLQISPTLVVGGSPVPPEFELLMKFNWLSTDCNSFLSQDSATGEGWASPYIWWALVKASWTYKMFPDYNFTWTIAGKQLAIIKAYAISSSPEWRQTAPVFVIPSQYSLFKTDKKRAAKMAMLTGAGRENESISALDEVTYYDEIGGMIDDI